MTTVNQHRATRKTQREVRSIVRSIVGGKGPSAARRVFLARFTASMFRSIHIAYRAKSVPGGRDELGIRWKRLKKSTVQAKLKKRLGVQRRISRELGASGMRGRQREAKARSLAAQMVPIGIESGDLLQSFRPGRVQGGRYVPSGPNQVAKITDEGVEMGSKLDYAQHFHSRRPIYPGMRKMRPWTRRALASARRELISWLKGKL